MTFSPKINSVREQRSFKRRGEKSKKNYKLRFGTVGLFFAQEGIMKTSYFRRVTKLIKNKFKRRSRRFKGLKRRVWFFLSLNYPLTMKSKNSRMGKGKGDFVAWAIRVKFGQPLVELKGFSFLFIKNIQLFFWKKMKIRLEVITKYKVRTVHKISALKVFTWNI